MIEWYKSDKLSIFFSDTPHVCVRYVLPSMTKIERQSIKRFPFICKTKLEVALFDHKKEKSFKFIIPKDYCYDGATIPRLFWRVIGSNTDNSFLIAALIHDVLCENHKYIDNDRELSSRVFKALLIASGVSEIKAGIMFSAVDVFQKIWGKWNV